MIERKHAIAASLLVALAGCASGPDYVRPETAMLPQWRVDTPETQPAAALPDWKEYFQDARLQALIARALEHNRDLRIATARIEEARAQYGISRADRLPAAEALLKREAALTPGDLNESGKPAHFQRYDAGVELLDYEIDFWGRVRRLNEASLASYLATEEAQRAFRLSLIADVAGAYFNQRALEEQVRLAQSVAENREEYRALAVQRREGGLISAMEALKAETAGEAARINLATLRQNLAAAEHWLQLLTGDPLADDAALPAGQELSAEKLPRLAPGIPSEMLLRRPDVLAAEQRLVAANASIGAARAAFLPRVSLTGMLSTASADLSRLFESGSRAWIFKPQLRVPLFDSGSLEGNVDLAQARRNVAVAEYEKAIQQAFREVADLLDARERLADQLQAREATEGHQARLVALMEARYKAQISHWLDVLDARRDLFAAQQSVAQTRRMALENAAQLYKALGGGAAPHAAVE